MKVVLCSYDAVALSSQIPSASYTGHLCYCCDNIESAPMFFQDTGSGLKTCKSARRVTCHRRRRVSRGWLAVLIAFPPALLLLLLLLMLMLLLRSLLTDWQFWLTLLAV